MKKQNHATLLFITPAMSILVCLTSCSEKHAAGDKTPQKNAASSQSAVTPRTSGNARKKALDINLNPDLKKIAKVVRHVDGTEHTLYEETHGPMADHVKLSISTIKPNRIVTLAENGTDQTGFNTDGEWFGKGAKRERVQYGEHGAKTVIYECRQLQSAMGKPPFALKATRTAFLADSGLIDGIETITHGQFPATDEAGLMLATRFEDLKNEPGAEYKDVRHDFTFK